MAAPMPVAPPPGVGVTSADLPVGSAMAEALEAQPPQAPRPPVAPLPVLPALPGVASAPATPAGPFEVQPPALPPAGTASVAPAAPERPGRGLGGFAVEAGAAYLRPHWKANPAFQTAVPDPATGNAVLRQQDFPDDGQIAPRVTLAYTLPNGPGLRARWWGFAQDARLSAGGDEAGVLAPVATVTTAAPLGVSLSSLLLPFPGPFAATATSSLRLDVWDLEAFDAARWDDWALTYGGGVRYAHLSQHYDAALIDATTGDPVASLRSGHNMNGYGPTGAVEVRRTLGNTGIALFGSARGSLLFGKHAEDAGLVILAGLPPAPGVQAHASRDDVVPVAELEVGAAYQRSLGRMQVFVQSGLVGQVWFGAGNAANTNGFQAEGARTGQPNNTADLGLFGVSLTAGVRY
jgi:hypothetical protein